VLAESSVEAGYGSRHGRETWLDEKFSSTQFFDKLRCLESIRAERICCSGTFRQRQERHMKDSEVGGNDKL
jgi:hypothetical protein